MPITDPAVLDLLPGDAIVFVTIRHSYDDHWTKVFHLWARECWNVSVPTEESTIAAARARDLGLCGSCALRAQKRARRAARAADDQGRERKAGA